MDLLEREDFFQQLQDILVEVINGHGRVALVSGEAGIGKTSLVEQFAATAKNTCRVLWGGCDALFTPRPLGPLHDIALQIRGDLLTLLDQEASRATIFSAVFEELQSQPPTLLVFEDVHWADEATLDLLKFLGRRINKLNSLLVITYRDDEVQAEHPLRLVLGDLPRSSVKRVRLPPLSEDAVDELAARAGKRVEDLYAVTAGNPFFVTEALASQDAEARSNLEMAKGDNDRWLQAEFAFWLWRAGATPTIEQEIAEPYALQIVGDWRAAADRWQELGCPYEAATALGEGDEEAQLEALAIFEKLGASPAAERLRQKLRTTGVRGIPRGPRPSTRDNPAGLTARQMKVLSLLSDGCTNTEIAERLFISNKTVDHHVSAILAKLDAQNRAEAVSVALQSNLINPK